MAEWHTSGAFAVPTVNQRTSFYNVSGVPHVRIDGKYAAIGAGSCSAAASTYRNYINTRLTETGGVAPVAIEGVHSVGASDITMTVTFTLDDPVTLLSPRAYLLILESNIPYGSDTYNHIVRAEHHEDITALVNPGDQATVEYSFPISGWNLDEIQCVAFLQKMTGDKEMYNAANIPVVADFEFAWDQSIISLPNASGTAMFEGTLTNISEASDDLTLTLDNTFGWPAEFKVEGEAGYHTTPSQITLGAQEAVQVYLRVETDTEHRIGEGELAIYSATSDRTGRFKARVFNGSQAILFVDDDNGVHTTEQPFMTAMDNGGYLYDTWDARNDHSGFGPAFDVMAPYDLILWITGYDFGDILTTEDQENLMAFMDTGKGVVLSSADFLSGFAGPNTLTTDYLGIASWQANVGATQANGVAGDPISDGMNLVLNYSHSSYNRADRITPNAIATTIFHNAASHPIGVRADNGTARAVTFTFAAAVTEPNPDPSNLTTLIDRSFGWIWEGQSQAVGELPLTAMTSRIAGIAPNPLSFSVGRGEATLRLRLSAAGAQAPIRLDVLDLTGRLVRNVVAGTLPSGVNALTWDGRDRDGHRVSAGVYYARLTTLEGSQSARMVIVR